MAGVLKVHGKYESGEMIHRDLFFKTITLAASTQDALDAAMKEIELRSTIEVIGTWNNDATVNVIISGADVTTIVGGSAADIAGW